MNAITILTILAGLLGFLSGTMALSIYLVMRPGGMAEKIVAQRVDHGDSLKKAVDTMKVETANLKIEMATIEGVLDKKTALLENRISSFETRYGKRSKKEEQADLQSQIFEAVPTNSI